MTVAMIEIPPFPLPHYQSSRDRLRHWAALQGNRVFSPTEMLVGAGLLGARAAIRDLVKAGELTRLGHKKLQVVKLSPIIDRQAPPREAPPKLTTWELLAREIEQAVVQPRSGNVHGFVHEHWKDLWATVNIYWKHALYDAPWVEKAVFTDVPLRRRPGADYEAAYDFWPRADIEVFKGAPRYSYRDPTFAVRRGTQQTAAMLGHAQNAEDVAAVWIAAFAFDNGGGRNHLEESWRGRVHAMVRALEFITQHYFETRRHLYPWHHAMTEVRPASALKRNLIVPKDLHDCISIAALDAVLSHALYVPIRFIPTDLDVVPKV